MKMGEGRKGNSVSGRDHVLLLGTVVSLQEGIFKFTFLQLAFSFPLSNKAALRHVLDHAFTDRICDINQPNLPQFYPLHTSITWSFQPPPASTRYPRHFCHTHHPYIRPIDYYFTPSSLWEYPPTSSSRPTPTSSPRPRCIPWPSTHLRPIRICRVCEPKSRWCPGIF